MEGIVKALAAVAAADFVSGFVHWAEDAYAKPGPGWLGKIAGDNLLHHEKPRAFLTKTYWESSWDLLVFGALLLAVLAALGALSWPWVLFVALSANANQIHKWAHRNSTENPRLVIWLQRARLIASPRDHSAHHRGTRDSHYCVITPWLNPVLDRWGFWRALEHMVQSIAGVRPRPA